MELRPYQQDAVNKIKKRLKEASHPLLVNMSVGAGKSLVCSSLLSMIEAANFRALCLTMNSTLISQNHITHQSQGGNSGIYCSGLKELDYTKPIIFGSPQSVAIAIKHKKPLSEIKFNLIIIDECQNVDAHNPSSLYMRILNWYAFKAQESQYSFRVIGLSGTPYRGKSISIVGNEEYFKEEVVKIQMPWLIENGYLTKPHFGITKSEHIDFSQCKIDSTGKFNNNDLEKAIKKDERLSGQIMRELIDIVEPSNGGAFVFCSTIKHVFECMKSLPSNAAAITAATPHEERKRILEAANNGKIKYLVNVATLLVGIDCPRFHIAAFLRPTESLTLYTQAIGRALRLFPEKERALVLDFAGNLNRFADFDDPLINEAIKPKIKDDPEYCIQCYECNSMNKITSRRCIGMQNNKRCDYYFEFKECPKCQCTNDKVARQCRQCNCELIDPNAKLKLIEPTYELHVHSHEIKIEHDGRGQAMVWLTTYQTNQGRITEHYTLATQKGRNIFYGNFVRKHVNKASSYYMGLHNFEILNKMIKDVKMPMKLIVNAEGRIKKKEFS